jgi:hypothetical protein
MSKFRFCLRTRDILPSQSRNLFKIKRTYFFRIVQEFVLFAVHTSAFLVGICRTVLRLFSNLGVTLVFFLLFGRDEYSILVCKNITELYPELQN